MADISPRHERWLREERGLTNASIDRGLVRTEGEELVYSYLRNGQEVNCKYRAPGKKFRQKVGGQQCFFNVDCLTANPDDVYIVEGEMDVLAMIEAGFWNTISVPSGRQEPQKEKKREEREAPAYLALDRDRLIKAKRIILALDNDVVGLATRDELISHLGRGRCWLVTWNGVKDANEFLILTGPEALRHYVLSEVKPYPIRGHVLWHDVLPTSDEETFPIRLLNNQTKLSRKTISIITGYPNHGKSTFAKQIAVDLIKDFGLGVMIASFEDRLHNELKPELMGMWAGKRIKHAKVEEVAEADIALGRRVSFLFDSSVTDKDPDPNAEPLDVRWLVDAIRDVKLRQRVDIVIIDPWNELEHLWDKGLTETDYVGRALKELRHLAIECDVHIMIVAHPVKPAAKDEGKPPGNYAVSGSAHFVNKADLLIVVHRPNFTLNSNDTAMDVYVRKVKRHELGERCEVSLIYDPIARILKS